MFSTQTDAAIMLHALEAYPAEACGVVINGKYLRLPNASVYADQEFDCSHLVSDLVRQGLVIEGVAHSHPHSLRTPPDAPHTRDDPKNPPWPTETDMRSQQDMGVPWCIVATDGRNVMDPLWWGPGVPIPPLEGRDYRWGPSGSDGKGDCLALIRDWYQVERGVELPDCPREYGWWERGKNLYEEHVTPFGFVEVWGEPEIGDVFLMQAGSGVLNHGGVFVGGGEILHHPADKLSKRIPVRAILRQHEVRWFRHA